MYIILEDFLPTSDMQVTNDMNLTYQRKKIITNDRYQRENGIFKYPYYGIINLALCI